MDWMQRLTAAVDYLETHLEEPLDASELAGITGSSAFHFQRMFHMVTGSTVADYLRRRKLTLAAQELASTKAKVLDVALKYGYDTPESFAKAFRRLHGISPSEARESGSVLKAYPRISFHLSLKGDKDIGYRIIERPAFPVIGKTRTISTKDGLNYRQVAEFWQDSLRDNTEDRLLPYCKTKATLGICLDMDMAREQFTYMIAVESDRAPESGEFAARTIPACTWAVFDCIGPMPQAMQQLLGRIWQEWFPATGYELAAAPELEVYFHGNARAADYRSEAWMPLKTR